jgi:2-polyprenyl-3-methyl-5-hydroxy-6-metoxy-1,4-benzoquinol methylase
MFMQKNVSNRYLGDKGQLYESIRQSDPRALGYEIDFNYFKPFFTRQQRVLDFGCGNGGLLSHAIEVAGKAEGVEVNEAAIKLARNTGACIYSGIEQLPPDAVYDIIYSNHCLEHVRDVCGTLETLRSHLKPGGFLLLKLPIDDANASHQRKWRNVDVAHHLYTWTPRLLSNLLRETGYEVKDCRVITSAWHPRLYFLRCLGLTNFAFWAFSVLKKRRQLFAVAINPLPVPIS